MTQPAENFNLETFFNALADRTRLRLINLMENDEVCVCFFVEILGANQPKISRHLAYLKKAGIVETRREGNWMHYRIAELPDEGATRIFSELRYYLKNDPEMLADRLKLVDVCCGPERPAGIQGAPIPASLISQSCGINC